MRARHRFSAAEARRIAFDAQGFGRQPAAVGTKQLNALLRRIDVLQLDSVNVFERSHYLPFLARLGAYDTTLLDRLLQHDRPRRRLGAYLEYWAHEAAVIPVADWPLYGWRRDAFLDRQGRRAWVEDRPGIAEAVRRDLHEHGPLKVRDIEHAANVSTGGGWWNKNDVHWMVQMLFGAGEVVAVGRTRFERSYALAADAIPTEQQTNIPRDDAQRELLRRASVALGIATLDDLRDYHRLPYLAEAKPLVDDLVGAGELQPVDVEGWGKPAYLHTAQRVPRSMDATALLSPFDPMVWFRPRSERLFDFHYRISIYTPEADREHGYYVLPVVVGDDVVGRIDLKADRKAGVLRVQHAHIEPQHAGRAGELAERISPRIIEAAGWRGLADVVVSGTGTWARDVAAALRTNVRAN